MRIPSKERINALRETYKGKRIKLIEMDDPQAPPKGTLGTCWEVDDMASLLVEWDNGSSLNLLPERDLFQIVKEGRQCESGEKQGA